MTGVFSVKFCRLPKNQKQTPGPQIQTVNHHLLGTSHQPQGVALLRLPRQMTTATETRKMSWKKKHSLSTGKINFLCFGLLFCSYCHGATAQNVDLWISVTLIRWLGQCWRLHWHVILAVNNPHGAVNHTLDVCRLGIFCCLLPYCFQAPQQEKYSASYRPYVFLVYRPEHSSDTRRMFSCLLCNVFGMWTRLGCLHLYKQSSAT